MLDKEEGVYREEHVRNMDFFPLRLDKKINQKQNKTKFSFHSVEHRYPKIHILTS